MKRLVFCFAMCLFVGGVWAEGPARRVVSLAPSLTELIFDAGWGDRQIARSDACDFPPEAVALPVAGSFGRPNVEWLLREKPDLVVSTDLERPGLAKTLREAGIEYRRLPCESWEQMLDAVRALGEALGDEAGASNWIARAQTRRDVLARRVDAFWEGKERPRVYFEVWSDPLTTPGHESFVTDLISLAGGRSIGAELRDSYAHVSAEWVLSENPDVIVLAYMIPRAEPSAAYLARRPGWKSLRALKSDAICTTIPAEWLLRPGPRWMQGAEALDAFLEGRMSAGAFAPSQ